MKVAFTLRGLSSLIQHADDIERADFLKQWRSDPRNSGVSVKGDDRTPAWTWQTYLYHDGTHITIPQDNLSVCLRAAGGQMSLKGNTTFKKLTQSGMRIESEFLEFRCGKDNLQRSIADVFALQHLEFSQQANYVREKLGFRLFLKRAKVGATKHIRVRPRFDDWTIRGTALIVAQELKIDVIRRLFEIAGSVGLGDWRPGSKTPGPFGVFESTVEKIE